MPPLNPLSTVVENLQDPTVTPNPTSTSQLIPTNPAKLPNPSEAPECLHLSGKIISATCFTPYTLGYRTQPRTEATSTPWEITPRRGSSALFDTLQHLARQESGWEHTVVGWTGEIHEIQDDGEVRGDQHLQDPRVVSEGLARPGTAAPANTKAVSPGNRGMNPVHMMSGTTDRMTMKGDYSKPPAVEKPCVSRADREELERGLGVKAREDGWDNIKPVWLGDEEKRGFPLVDIGRWREYAEKGILGPGVKM